MFPLLQPYRLIFSRSGKSKLGPALKILLGTLCQLIIKLANIKVFENNPKESHFFFKLTIEQNRTPLSNVDIVIFGKISMLLLSKGDFLNAFQTL